MRVVLDSNVFVSGVLSPSGPPGWTVEAALTGDLELVFDSGILAEYEEVLFRPELRLPGARVRELLEAIESFGTLVSAPPWPEPLPDPDDGPFLAAAAAVGCPLVTGNIRHFPARARRGVTVVSPREFLERLAAGG
jgi:putative PIN family toxin of toxin-antitoxin system